jgi:hypothetical protein
MTTKTTPKIDELDKILGKHPSLIVGTFRGEPILKPNTMKLKQALNHQALATALRLIGDDEVLEDGYGEGMPTQWQHTQNVLRRKLRQAFEKEYGASDG